ncbi:transcriptional regulator [Pseudonocardiaceae bacterium YIM PH 21723]|nr:transcriptional regulator [Pseudonocardiaceae bacterium YIM PH 21723]
MSSSGQAIAAVATLDDPHRSGLYRFVRAARRPVGRDEAAEAVGISRKLAAFHLDKLVDAGLLQAGSAPVGRVGRRPKVYTPATDDLRVCLPPREPGLLASVLMDALLARAAGESAQQAVTRVAEERGERVGTAARGAELLDLLTEHGFEPERAEDGLRLRNCPFHPLVAQQPELVCGLNHAYLSGLLTGLRDASVHARLQPEPGECCVRLDPSTG